MPVENDWFYRRGGRVHGPVSLADLRAARLLGFVDAADVVRRRHSATWEVAGLVPELADLEEPTRPPPVPPPVPVAPGRGTEAPSCFLAIDGFVDRLYRSGFVQSLILHMAVLLAMAVVVVQPWKPQAVPPLVLAFDAEPVPPIMTEEDPLSEIVLAPAPATSEDDAMAAEVMVEESGLVIDDVSVEAFDTASPEPPAFLALPDESDLLAELQPTGSSRARRRGVMPAAFDGGPGDEAAGGDAFGGEIGRRLAAAGARTGDVQVSIAWDNGNDIDVHVMVEPLRSGPQSLICWFSRHGSCGGMLDVDANAHPAMLTNRPVENVFWRQGGAPYGRYTIAVHHYQNWAGPPRTPVEVAVLVDGKVERFRPVVTFGQGPQVVTTFVRRLPSRER